MEYSNKLIATKAGEKCAKDFEISELPVDPFAIAEKLDIEVRTLDSNTPGVSGMLMFESLTNSFGIMHATYIDNKGFQNFCVAHELGHYHLPGHHERLLSEGVHISKGGFHSNDRFELEADHFAAGLLMPSFLFSKAIDKLQSGIEAILMLSKKCETSIIATAIRYAELTHEPLAIIVSKGNTIDYCFMSEELRNVQGLTWIRKNDVLPRTSKSFEFNQNENNVVKGLSAESSSTLLDWFDCEVECSVYEEIIGLGQYGKTLTVLTIEDLPDDEDETDLEDAWTPKFKR